MNILAIDPGNKESAYCKWNGEKIKVFGKCANEELKGRLHSADDCIVVIEMVQSFGMAVGREIFETVLFIGQLMEVCNWCKIPCHLIYRKDVKIHFCNSMKAKDSNIRQALIDRFGDKGTKAKKGLTYGISKDVWSAFAISVFYYDTMSIGQAVHASVATDAK
jgi:hypothetical protein